MNIRVQICIIFYLFLTYDGLVYTISLFIRFISGPYPLSSRVADSLQMVNNSAVSFSWHCILPCQQMTLYLRHPHQDNPLPLSLNTTLRPQHPVGVSLITAFQVILKLVLPVLVGIP